MLHKQGYLASIVKGWYFLSRPTDTPGESTAWYAVFWNFLSIYLQTRFDNEYCLSATSSLHVHVGSHIIPKQIIATSSRGGKSVLKLPHGISLLTYEERNSLPPDCVTANGLRIMPLDLTLARLPATCFQQNQFDVEIAIQSLPSVTVLIRRLLSRNYIAAAQRLAGTYEFMGKHQLADEIVSAMKAAGHSFTPINPFEKKRPRLPTLTRTASPYAARIAALFSSMREVVETEFSSFVPNKQNAQAYIKHIDDVYVYDAYHSLSIEGYQVTPELIKRIRSAKWNPEHNKWDHEERNAMAAKGYLEAFLTVKKSVGNILNGEPAVDAVQSDFGQWYRDLFSASVQAGILKPHNLAGFRANQVFIRGSRHVPPPSSAVEDSMDMLFEQLREQSAPGARAILGHFIFTFIHPYMDGNGRIGRFIMNAMMAADGIPWTIIRANRRQEYMAALESASCKGDIKPFARLIIQESKVNWL